MGVGEDVYIHTCGCVCLYQIAGVELMYGGVEIDEGVCMCARALGCVCMFVCVCVCVCVLMNSGFLAQGSCMVVLSLMVCVCVRKCVCLDTSGCGWVWGGYDE